MIAVGFCSIAFLTRTFANESARKQLFSLFICLFEFRPSCDLPAGSPDPEDPGSSLPTYFRMELILYSKYVHQWTNTEFNKFLLFFPTHALYYFLHLRADRIAD